jgi:hypothetical protein
MALMFLVAASVTRVEAATTPDLTSQQVEAVIETHRQLADGRSPLQLSLTALS